MDGGIASQSIGVFDSGFGGVDVLRGIVNRLPQYNYIYLGDSARVPYGSRYDSEIYEFAKQAVDFLFSKNCDLIIFACNTASSTALRKIQQEYLLEKYKGKRVLGVLIPAVEEAVSQTKNNKIGVLGTESTINSNAFEIEIHKINPEINVFQKACPLLVPIVESGKQNDPETETVLNGYIKPLLDKRIDTLILGCTHYGILENQIKKIVGNSVNIISENRVVPEKLEDYLENHPEFEKKLGKNGTVKFYTTDTTDRFQTLGSEFFGSRIKAEKVTVERV